MSKRARVRWLRSWIALRIAPWLADAKVDETMKFFRQHYTSEGRSKRTFKNKQSAITWCESHHGQRYMPYRCGVCLKWHMTSSNRIARRHVKEEVLDA